MRQLFAVKSGFARNVITLASGTAAAQALTILAAPVLTRLYRPEDYGVLALWSAVGGIGALLASGKYEGAILLPKEDAEAVSLVYLSVGLTGAFALAMLIAVIVAGPAIARLFDSPELAPWLLLLPVMLIVTNLGQSLSAWANRRQAYRMLAASRISTAVAGTGLNLLLGFAGAGAAGLIGGVLVGQVVGLTVLAWQFWRRDRCGTTTLAAMKAQAWRYRDFPRFTVWADLINLGSTQLIALMLPRMFGLAVLGAYAMSQRVIAVPFTLIGSAVAEVFRGRASRDYTEQGNCREIFDQTLKRLTLLGMVPFALIVIAAPSLFAVVFGEQWRMAGTIAQIMSVMYALKFVVSPLSHTFFLAGRQREDLLVHMWMLFSSMAALWAGHRLFGTIQASLLSFSLNFSSIYVYTLVRSRAFSAGFSNA